MYFYKEKLAMVSQEFQNTASKDIIVQNLNKRYKNSLFENKHTKKQENGFSKEVYEWENPAGGVILMYRTHPILGERLNVYYVIKGIIDDPEYFKNTMPEFLPM